MTLQEARAILVPPLVFGDARQIDAANLIEVAELIKSAAPRSALCPYCDDPSDRLWVELDHSNSGRNFCPRCDRRIVLIYHLDYVQYLEEPLLRELAAILTARKEAAA